MAHHKRGRVRKWSGNVFCLLWQQIHYKVTCMMHVYHRITLLKYVRLNFRGLVQRLQ